MTATIQVVCEQHGVQNLTPGPFTVTGLPLRCPKCTGTVPVDPSEPEKPQRLLEPPLYNPLHWADDRLEASDSEWKRQQAERLAEDKDAVLRDLAEIATKFTHPHYAVDDCANDALSLSRRAQRLMKGTGGNDGKNQS